MTLNTCVSDWDVKVHDNCINLNISYKSSWEGVSAHVMCLVMRVKINISFAQGRTSNTIVLNWTVSRGIFNNKNQAPAIRSCFVYDWKTHYNKCVFR